MSGFWLSREKYSDHWCVQKINIERICKRSKSYFIIVTMDQKTKNRQGMAPWICRQDKRSRTAVYGENERVKHSHNSWSTASRPSSWHPIGAHSRIRPWIYDIALQALPVETPLLLSRTAGKRQNPYLSLYEERWADKQLSLTIAMLKFYRIRRPDSFRDEWSGEADGKGRCMRMIFIYRPRCHGVNGGKGKNQPDETERLLI